MSGSPKVEFRKFGREPSFGAREAADLRGGVVDRRTKGAAGDYNVAVNDGKLSDALAAGKSGRDRRSGLKASACPSTRSALLKTTLISQFLPI
jgi:hypothetical protein